MRILGEITKRVRQQGQQTEYFRREEKIGK
jgi:hypothetical protein